jgi:hypothetical protein
MWTLRLAPQRCSPMRAGGGGCLLPRGPSWGGRTAPFHHCRRHPITMPIAGAVASPAGHHPGGAAHAVATPNCAHSSPPRLRSFHVPHGAPANRRKTGPGPAPRRQKKRRSTGAIWCTFGALERERAGNCRWGQKPLSQLPGQRRSGPAGTRRFLAGSDRQREQRPGKNCLPVSTPQMPPRGGSLPRGNRGRIRSRRMNQRRPTHANDIRRSIRTPLQATLACSRDISIG